MLKFPGPTNEHYYGSAVTACTAAEDTDWGIKTLQNWGRRQALEFAQSMKICQISSFEARGSLRVILGHSRAVQEASIKVHP